MEDIEVTVEELLSGLKRRNLPLPFEIGAFIALEACEQMLDRPVRLDARDIGIGDIGEVVCSGKKSPVNEESAVRALLLLLSELLMCSAPGVPAMLLELVERGPSNGKWTLERLRDDLEACLVPLNRGATRRVLARLTREARKAGLERARERDRDRDRKSQPSIVPAASEIDAQFDALMAAGERASPLAAAAAAPRGVQSSSRAPSSAVASAFATPNAVARTPAASPSPLPRGSFAREDDATTLEFETSRASRSAGAQAASLRALRSAAASQEPPPVAASPRSRRVSPSDVELIEPGELGRAPARTTRREEREEQTRDEHEERDERSASPLPAPAVDDLLADMPDRERSRAPALLGWSLAVAAVALAGAYLALGQSGARRVLGLAPVAEAPLPEEPLAATRPARASGELRVTSEPGRAQVFLFVGNGPATATDLPIGVAQEFLAMAEGHAPTRAVVPADAQWEDVSTGQQPRYELAMQAGKLEAPDQALELGATLLPRDVGAPTGQLGTARVITTPRAAKVYLLIGFTPDVRVENLPLDAGYELLVYLPGYGMQTRRVEPGDFREQDGKRIADVSLQLTAARGRRN